MTAVDLALAGLALTFLASLGRMAVGPTRADRVVAADLSFFVLVGAIALMSVRTGAGAFVDIAVVATLVGFLGSLALAGLIHRGRS